MGPTYGWLGPTSNTVNKLQPSDGTLRRKDGAILSQIAVGERPFDLAFDGSHVWVANSGQSTVMRPPHDSTGVPRTVRVGIGPRGTFFDGSIWVAIPSGSSIAKITLPH